MITDVQGKTIAAGGRQDQHWIQLSLPKQDSVLRIIRRLLSTAQFKNATAEILSGDVAKYSPRIRALRERDARCTVSTLATRYLEFDRTRPLECRVRDMRVALSSSVIGSGHSKTWYVISL